MRSEGFSFNSGGLGALVRDSLSCVCSRLQTFAVALTLGEAFGWQHDVSDSGEIARKRMET